MNVKSVDQRDDIFGNINVSVQKGNTQSFSFSIGTSPQHGWVRDLTIPNVTHVILPDEAKDADNQAFKAILFDQLFKNPESNLSWEEMIYKPMMNNDWWYRLFTQSYGDDRARANVLATIWFRNNGDDFKRIPQEKLTPLDEAVVKNILLRTSWTDQASYQKVIRVSPKIPTLGKMLGDALELNTVSSLTLDSPSLFLFEALGQVLKTNTTLKSLTFTSGTSYTLPTAGVDALVEGLEVNKNLKDLSFWNISIGNETAIALAKVLKTNKTLTGLILLNGHSNRNQIEYEGGQAIAEALKTNATLTSLDLSRNNIGSEGFKAIAEALLSNTTLTTLTLNRNLLGEPADKMLEAIKAISNALKINSTLSTLNLENNNMGDEDICLIAEALKSNRGLTSLKLNSNFFDDKASLVLAEALGSNSTLKDLDLSDCILENEMMKILVKGLETNHGLHSLLLKNNRNINDESVPAMVDFLEHNSTLRSLDLQGTRFSHEGIKTISKVLEEKNKTLTYLIFNSGIPKEIIPYLDRNKKLAEAAGSDVP